MSKMEFCCGLIMVYLHDEFVCQSMRLRVVPTWCCLGLIVVHVYYESDCQRGRFRVVPEGVEFRAVDGAFLL
jgi:hypothetical protein